MKRIMVLVPALLLMYCANAAETTDSVVKNGYKLVVTDKSDNFDPKLKETLKEVFFKVYPPMVERFNPKATKRVVFVIDPEYDGVAATFRGRVVYSDRWFKNNPKDIDVVTHEVMHIVQNYGRTSAPGWITEGIADYARYKYGVANEEGNWHMPDVNPSQSYTNSYRITARFFAWLENHKNAKIIDNLDKAVRDRSYDDAFWKNETSKTIDELWDEYLKSPKL